MDNESHSMTWDLWLDKVITKYYQGPYEIKFGSIDGSKSTAKVNDKVVGEWNKATFSGWIN